MNSEVSYETVTFFILAVIQTWMILKEHSADLTLNSCNIIVQCPKTIIKIDPAEPEMLSFFYSKHYCMES